MTFSRQSLVEQIENGIHASIREGIWKEHLPSERSLSKTFHASRPVVRQAIHHLREKGLLQTARGRLTRIAKPAQNSKMAGNDRRVILLTGPWIEADSPFILIAMSAIRADLEGRGHAFEVAVEPNLHRLSATALGRLVERHDATRWILAATPESVQSWFQRQNLQVVSMGNTFPGIDFPFVNDDLRAKCRHAAGMCLGAGHRNIVFFLRALGGAGTSMETAGFLEAFRPEHREAAYGVVTHSGDIEQLLRRLRSLFSGKRRPTALLVSHATDTLVVITWLLKKGIRVPEEVSLISIQWEGFLERMRPLPAWYKSDPRKHAGRLCRLVAGSARHHKAGNLIMPDFFDNGAIRRLPV